MSKAIVNENQDIETNDVVTEKTFEEAVESSATALTVAPIQVYELDGKDFCGELISQRKSYCSFISDTPKGKKILFKALSDADFKLKEQINREISVVDIYVEQITLRSEKTGELQEVPRIVLIDINGKSYQCCSVGVFNSIKAIFLAYGKPTWFPAIKVTPFLKSIGKENNVLTLKLVD
jgi:hypothetical protein